MFAGLGSAAPKLPTRRAMVLLNMQNDSFGSDDLIVCHPTDFVDRCRVMLPYWRKLGDVIWIKTEFAPEPYVEGSARSSPRLSSESPRAGSVDSNDSGHPQLQPRLGLENYFASHRQRVKKRKEAKDRTERVVNDNIEPFEFDSGGERIEDYVTKPRKTKLPSLYQPGTKGADFCDAIASQVDHGKDVILTKHHYSGFDSTSLLMTLRMNFITQIYLAGCISNVSIYETAADAVRHGFDVTVVEDCMGYRSAAKHLEAMRKMADGLGVSGIDSEEIIEESGGQAPPDAEESFITGPGISGIQGMNLGSLSASSDGSPRDQGEPTEMEDVTMEDQIEIDMVQKLALDSEASRSTATFVPKVNKKATRFQDLPLKKPGDLIGEGDSSVIYNALAGNLASDAFRLIRDEVDWQVMHHRSGEVPRRVAVQGDIQHDGSIPVYRHPADESPPLRPFSKTVSKVREDLQRLLKQPFNHVLIQLYRDGNDNISEHSDKTLDIVRGSNIINMSFGAQRRMTLRTKKSDQAQSRDGSTPVQRLTQTVPMPHNSVFVLGWRSNRKWLHGVRPDKRPPLEKSLEERAFNGERISLTFRHIGTFVNADGTKIWGQGAVSKFQATAGPVSSTDSKEMEAMVIAFGKENQQSNFDWDAEYGRGFDVMNLVVARSTLFLAAGDELANLRVKMCLQHSGITYRATRQPVPAPSTPSSTRSAASSIARRNIFALTPADSAPIFRDIDSACSEVVGDLAILFYLSNLYPAGAVGSAAAKTAALTRPQKQQDGSASSTREAQRLASNTFARITQANELLFLWQELRGEPLTASTRSTHQIRWLGSETTTASGGAGAAAAAANGAGTAVSTPISSHQMPGFMSPGGGREESPSEVFDAELSIWEEYAKETGFMAGDTYAIVDCAFWPVLNEVVRRWEGWSERKFPHLANYWRKVGALESTRAALAEAGD